MCTEKVTGIQIHWNIRYENRNEKGQHHKYLWSGTAHRCYVNRNRLYFYYLYIRFSSLSISGQTGGEKMTICTFPVHFCCTLSLFLTTTNDFIQGRQVNLWALRLISGNREFVSICPCYKFDTFLGDNDDVLLFINRVVVQKTSTK